MWFIIIASVVSLIIILAANKGAPAPEEPNWKALKKSRSHPVTPESAGETLATGMLGVIDNVLGDEHTRFLNRSELTQNETIFFSAYFICSIAMGSIGGGSRAAEFEKSFTSVVKQRIGPIYSKMYVGRSDLYNRALESRSDAADGLAAVFIEFEFVIAHVIATGKFESFLNPTPLALLGTQNFFLHDEVHRFQLRLIESMHPGICALEKAFH